MIATSLFDWVSVSPEPLNAEALCAWASRPSCGGVVAFTGITRSPSSQGQDVIALEYETEPAFAEARMAAIVGEARRRWPELGAVALHHRVGRVALSEAAVVVVVAAPHRHEAFEAARFCIDALKRSVPMWKREIWEGGSAWSAEAQELVRVEDL